MQIRQLVALCLSVCLIASAISCGSDPETDTGSLVRALTSLRLPRSTDARVSIATVYLQCNSGNGVQCRAPSEGARLSQVSAIAARAAERIRAGYNPDALHAAALIDLLWTDSTGNSLRRAISSLRLVAQASMHSASSLVDLSAALIERAARTGSASDLVEAVDVAQRAIELDAVNAGARFDLALALDRLGLAAQANRAWREYVRIDTLSPWADEARVGMKRCDSIIGAGRDTGISPQDARVTGWDSVLGAWGTATSRNELTHADTLLKRADQLSQFANRPADASLSEAVRGIRASSGRGRLALARDYWAYAQGRRAFLNGDMDAARRSLKVAAGTSAPVLAAWATAYVAAAALQLGDTASAFRLLDPAIRQVDAERYPALAGQLHWTRAVVRIRVGQYERGLVESNLAEQLFARAGERENQGAVAFLQSSAYIVLGNRVAAIQSLQRTLRILESDRHSIFLHNTLLAWAEMESNGPVRAAQRIMDEDIGVADLSALPVATAGSRTLRASLRALQGDTAGAQTDVDSARMLVAAVPRGPLHRWLEANLAIVQASLRTGQPVTDASLDSAVDFFHEIRSAALEPRALAIRADARLTLGDTSGGAADLRRALTLLATQGEGVANTPLRVVFLDAARRTIDRLVLLRVQQPAEALAMLELGRAAVASASDSQTRAGDPIRSPSGTVVVDYSVIGDTVLSWTVRDTRVRLHRWTIRSDVLFTTIERVRAAVESRAVGALVDRDLSDLYRYLVAPIEADLERGDTSLAIVADGELAAIPFAALRDGNGHYLVESRVLRFSNSVRDVTVPRSAARRVPPAVLLISDPAFEANLHPELERLSGARAEVDSIRAIYPTARVLRDSAANRPTVEAALRGATVVHFAGHARIDEDEPARSALLLAGTTPTADLDAASIAALRFSRAPLVVLSACETAVPRAGRSGGLASLTGAFLRAGATGVVGSLWRVDDHDTQPLMAALHRAYSQSGDGAVALRAAQLQLIHGSAPALRAPMAWAAFRYTGS